MQRKLPIFLSLGLWASLAAFGQTATTSTRTLSLAPFGLGSTETARISVANLAAATSTGTAPSCTGSISFLNASGAVIGTATPYTLASGQLSSASLSFASAGLTGNRGELRAIITVTRTSGVPCQLVASLQTFDTSSGVTHLYVADAAGFDDGEGRH